MVHKRELVSYQKGKNQMAIIKRHKLIDDNYRMTGNNMIK